MERLSARGRRHEEEEEEEEEESPERLSNHLSRRARVLSEKNNGNIKHKKRSTEAL